MQVERIPLPLDARGRLDEAAWHRLRRVDFTASNVGALFGVSSRNTALAVFIDKAGRAGADAPGKYARRGHILEPVVADELGHRWPDAVIEKSHVYLRGRDHADPCLRVGSTNDYGLQRGGRRGPLEIKTMAPDWFRRHCPIHKGKPTPATEHVLQVRTQAMLDDADAGTLAILVCNDSADIHTFTVERDHRIEAAICRRISTFWRLFDAGKYPPLEFGHEAANLDRLPRRNTQPPPVVGDAHLVELANRHGVLVREILDRQRELAAAEDEIRLLMGEHAAVLLPDARRVSVGKYMSGRRIRIA
jgi:hypothetical protein